MKKRFSCTQSTEGEAYVEGWQRFDNDPDWTDGFEGVHEGRVFKVRTKVVKLMDAMMSNASLDFAS